MKERERHDRAPRPNEENDDKKDETNDEIADEEDPSTNQQDDDDDQHAVPKPGAVVERTNIVKQTIEEDNGTVFQVITTTVTHADGSQKVTETRVVVTHPMKQPPVTGCGTSTTR